MLSFDVSFLAVLVAALVSFMVGWLWYSSVLFGPTWMRLNGMTKKSTSGKKKGMMTSMIVGFIAQIVMSWVLAVFIVSTNSVGLMNGMIVAFWTWLGFVATIGLGSVLWDSKPMQLFWINTLHWLVSLLIMGALLGAWY